MPATAVHDIKTGITEFFSLFPDYIGEGVMGIIVTIVAGCVLAWITSKFFYKKDELTRIKGQLLEKKLEIYQELSTRADNLLSLMQYTPSQSQLTLEIMDRAGMERPKQLQAPAFLDNGESLRETLLDLDKWILKKRFLFDDEVAKASFVFQNYMEVYLRLGAIYEEYMKDQGLEDNRRVKNMESAMLRGLGFFLLEDLSSQVEALILAVRNSLNNLSFGRNVSMTFSYSEINDPENGPLKALFGTKIMTEKDKINEYIHQFLAAALAAVAMSPKPSGKKK